MYRKKKNQKNQEKQSWQKKKKKKKKKGMIASLVICCHDSLLPICWLWNLFKVKPVWTNVIGDNTSDHHAMFKNIHETDAEKKTSENKI